MCDAFWRVFGVRLLRCCNEFVAEVSSLEAWVGYMKCADWFDWKNGQRARRGVVEERDGWLCRMDRMCDVWPGDQGE
jgi:hypothetical protein